MSKIWADAIAHPIPPNKESRLYFQWISSVCKLLFVICGFLKLYVYLFISHYGLNKRLLFGFFS
jgi:hypothetical protein